MTLLFDIQKDPSDSKAVLVVKNEGVEFRQPASDRQLKRLLVDLAHYLDAASYNDTPTDRLDAEHHNAPKDGNDDPVIPEVENGE